MSNYAASADEGASMRLGELVKPVRRLARRDPDKWSRFRWLGSLNVYAVGSTIVGAALLLTGSQLILAQGAFALYARIPGGLRLHGFLLLLGGLPLLLCLALPMFGYPEPRKVMRVALVYLAGYYWWSTALFAGAAILPSGRFSFMGFFTWAMLACVLSLLAASEPPKLVSRVETELLEAMVDSGIPLETSRRVLRRYLGGHRAGQ